MKTILVPLFFAALASAQPPPVPAGTIVKRDIEYVPGGGPRETLDVYFPEKAEKPERHEKHEKPEKTEVLANAKCRL